MTAIARVDSVDLNGRGCKEGGVSWQRSTGVYLLGAYSLEEAMVRSLQYAASAPAGSAGAPVSGCPGQNMANMSTVTNLVTGNFGLSDRFCAQSRQPDA